jgi:hypothetical protein
VPDAKLNEFVWAGLRAEATAGWRDEKDCYLLNIRPSLSKRRRQNEGLGADVRSFAVIQFNTDFAMQKQPSLGAPGWTVEHSEFLSLP